MIKEMIIFVEENQFYVKREQSLKTEDIQRTFVERCTDLNWPIEYSCSLDITQVPSQNGSTTLRRQILQQVTHQTKTTTQNKQKFMLKGISEFLISYQNKILKTQKTQKKSIVGTLLTMLFLLALTTETYQQLLDKAEYVLKNYGDRGGGYSYPLDLHNSSDHTKAGSNNRFSIHQFKNKLKNASFERC